MAVSVVLAAALVAAVPLLFDVDRFRPELESRLSQALGREVKIGRLKVALLSRSLQADHIAIADNPAFGSLPFVSAKSIRIGIKLKPLLFSRAFHITGIFLDNPTINLVRSPSGKWNLSDLASGSVSRDRRPSSPSGTSALADVSIHRLRITGGRVTVIRPSCMPSVYEDVNITATNLSLSSEFLLDLTASISGNGKLMLKGKAGPLNQSDALRTPIAADIRITHLDLVTSGFTTKDSGIAGLIDFSGSVNSDGNLATSIGSAAISHLQLVKNGFPASRPTSLDYAFEHDLLLQRGTVRDAKVVCGSAAAGLSGSYEIRNNNLILNMKLQGSAMPLQDLNPLLPAFGVLLPKGASIEGGVLDVELAAQGAIENMTMIGTAQITRAHLVGFDLTGKMAALAALADLKSKAATEIEKFLGQVRISHEGTQVEYLHLIVADLGELMGSGKIGPDRSLDFKMQATLRPKGGIAHGLTRLSGGTLHVPFFIRGTASDPKFIPDVGAAARNLLKSSILGRGESDQANEQKDLRRTVRDLFRKRNE